MNEQEREAMLAEFHEWFFSVPGRPNIHWNPTLESWVAARAAQSIEEAFERGRQQGMAQEAALWELAQDAQDMGEYGAAQPSAPAVPQGWKLKREADGWIYFQRPDGMCQAITPKEPLGAHSETLFMLMTALLAQQEPKT